MTTWEKTTSLRLDGVSPDCTKMVVELSEGQRETRYPRPTCLPLGAVWGNVPPEDKLPKFRPEPEGVGLRTDDHDELPGAPG